MTEYIQNNPEIFKEQLSFLENNKDALSEIFSIMKLDYLADESLERIVAKTQPWARGDHHDPELKLNLDSKNKVHIINIAHEIGMVGEVIPKGGEYEQVLILGGEQRSNHARIDYALKLLESGFISCSESIVTLGGTRQIAMRELPALAKDLDSVDLLNPWVQQLLKKEKLVSFTEDDALRLAMLARVGTMNLEQAYIRQNNKDLYSHMIFSSSENIPKIATINATAVDRPLGERRHTTESTMMEWLNLLPPNEGSRILFVVNNPYIIRNARNLYNIIGTKRPDLDLDYCGAEAVVDESLWRRILGEIARNLYEDLRY